MSQKIKEDVFASWVNPLISITAFIFAREVSLHMVFLGVSPSSGWGVLTPKEDKRICSEYGIYIIPLYKHAFFSLVFTFPSITLR